MTENNTAQAVLTDDEILAATLYGQSDARIIRNGRAIEYTLLSKLRAPVAVPHGYALVPVEPTPGMIEVGATERVTPHASAGHGAIATYKAMLAAAPIAMEPSAPVAGEALTRFCPECGHVGDVGSGYRSCCPDGGSARMVPKSLADKCRATFQLAIKSDAAPQASEAVRSITFDGWLAKHCDSDDLTAYECELALDAWNAARTVEPLTLLGFDADRLRAIASSGSQTAMSNALMTVARALSAQPAKQEKERDS